MTEKPKRPFPRNLLLIGLASLPFWHAYFVSQGASPRVTVFVSGCAGVVFVLVLISSWRRANREGPGD